MPNVWEENARKARKLYPEGTRIELINMNDPFSPIAKGMRGTVDFIDDAGQIFMKWDNGHGLAIVPGVDEFRKLTPEEIEKENMSQQIVDDIKKYYSEGDIKKAYECYDNLFTLYTAPPEASPDVYMCNSKQLFRYTAQLDDKTVTDLANYGRQQEYRNKGYYNDVAQDEPDICE